MEIKLYLKMLQRRWWIVLLTVLVALNVALISAYLTKPTYQASVRFSVSPSASEMIDGQAILNSMDVLDKPTVAQTYAEFLNSERIYRETLVSMNLNLADMDDYTRSSVVIPSSNILELTVTGPNPDIVSKLANNVGQKAIQNVKALYRVYDITILDPAQVPTIPISPQPLRDGALAVLLGSVIGVALAITSEQVRVPLEAYRQRASMDSVSRVFTRRYLLNRIDEVIEKNPNSVTSLGMVRMNNLRDFIDTLPEGVVQQLMRQVAVILKKELRGNDLIGKWDEITFAIMLQETSDMAATRTMERISHALIKPLILENYGEMIYLEPTISVSTFQPGDSTGDLTGRAEASMEHNLIPGEYS
jgi:diguanylate cyclase (GGDEF)-like protein